MPRRRLSSAVALLAALVSLAACATASVTPEQLRQIETNNQSAIIMSYKEFQGMYAANVAFVNVETGRPYRMIMHGGDNWVGMGPETVAVSPGRYRLFSGALSSYDATGNMPLIGFWFKEFTVAPGEVVDVGTLHLTEIEARSISGIPNQVWNALLTLGDRRDTTTYIMYNVDYSDAARVDKMLADKYPSLVGRPVRRPLEPALDREQFQQIIAEAYAPGADGAPPSTDEARRRVGELLAAFVRRSVTETRNAPAGQPAQ